MEFKITLDNKPNLRRMVEKEPELAQQVIRTFVDMMEEAADPSKGIRWADLPKELAENRITFKQLVTGILRGTMDVQEINPDTFDVLKAEVHPFAYFATRKNMLDGTIKFPKWRKHFGFPHDTPLDEHSIAADMRSILRYTRYVDVQALQQALESNQVATYRGLGERAIELLPFVPALKYQQEHFGDLHVGKFFDEIGAFDCGPLPEGMSVTCSACKHKSLEDLGNYFICLSCNAGFTH